MEAAVPSAKRRRPEAVETPTKKTSTDGNQELPLPTVGAGEGGADRISGLPDEILCEIVTLLPTKDGACTQALASRWRHLWRAAPLNLDCRGLRDDDILTAVVSRVLSDHPGPCRHFAVPARHLQDRAAAVDAWLRSPALDSLQEIDFFGVRQNRWLELSSLPSPPPASAFRFSATLHVATIGQCFIPDGTAKTIRFPQLKHLALQQVCIAEVSLHSMISGCPALEHLLLNRSFGFRCIRINSGTLQSFGVIADYFGPSHRFRELVVEHAPCLERLLFSQRLDFGLKVSVVSAPKLETLGCLCDFFRDSSFMFGTTKFQGFRAVSLTTVMENVKILAVDSYRLNLDMVLDLMKCFPCLEKLYMKLFITGSRNLWRHKHRDFIRRFDIRLKTVVLESYRGTKSQVNLVTFFLVNAKQLEIMRLEVDEEYHSEEFSADQRTMLQMEKRASIGARLDFTTHRCRRHRLHIEHVHDLSGSDPFECTC